VTGMTAICGRCGAVYFIANSHACALAAFLPEGTPHPDPVLAERGWLVAGGIWQRTGGGGEEMAA
jgi:hypothetical protein